MRFLETRTVKIGLKVDERIGSDTSEDASEDKEKRTRKECKRKGDSAKLLRRETCPVLV